MTLLEIGGSQRRAARVVGFTYLYVIVGCFISADVVKPMLIVPGDAAATARNLGAHELLFRVGLVHEMIMAACVVVMAVAFYVLVKPVSRHLALLALSWRVVEAGLWAVTVLVSLVAARVASDGAPRGSFTLGERHDVVAMLLAASPAGMDVVILFTGVGGTLFAWLTYQGRYVPRPLAAWGIATYVTMVLYSSAKLISPDLARLDAVVYTPGAVFEALLGAWLLWKGATAATPEARWGRHASAGPRPFSESTAASSASTGAPSPTSRP